ncbi:MAG: chemotaxis protein CheX [Robiginitomaculum sp.]|nr:MAG: chemotaxis protein CheX [Robiginitomaculum sp.]
MTDTNTTDAPQAIPLTSNLDLTAAAPLCEALQTVRGQAAHLAGQDVERLGAQCAQVLLSASEAWKADDQPFFVSDPSPQFQDGLKTLGLASDIFDQ